MALVSLRHCFHEATGADALKSSFRTTVVMHFDLLWELWGRFKPNPGPTPMLPTAAEVSSIPAVAAPVVHLDVLQTLNLQSQWQKCKTMAHASCGERFQPHFLSHLVLGLRGDSSPISVHGRPASIGAHPGGGWGRGTGAGCGWGASSWRPWRLAGRERGCPGCSCPSLHSPLNNGALLLWWAWASSTNTPGCGRTMLQLLQAVSVPPTPVLPTGLSCKPPVPASAHPSKCVSQAGTPRAVA